MEVLQLGFLETPLPPLSQLLELIRNNLALPLPVFMSSTICPSQPAYGDSIKMLSFANPTFERSGRSSGCRFTANGSPGRVGGIQSSSSSPSVSYGLAYVTNITITTIAAIHPLPKLRCHATWPAKMRGIGGRVVPGTLLRQPCIARFILGSRSVPNREKLGYMSSQLAYAFVTSASSQPSVQA